MSDTNSPISRPGKIEKCPACGDWYYHEDVKLCYACRPKLNDKFKEIIKKRFDHV